MSLSLSNKLSFAEIPLVNIISGSIRAMILFENNCVIFASCAMLFPNLVQVTESIFGSVVPLELWQYV